MKSDFNGDGKAHVLWQNISGSRAPRAHERHLFWQQHLPAIGGDLLEDRRIRELGELLDALIHVHRQSHERILRVRL